jgi:hypothetical protein
MQTLFDPMCRPAGIIGGIAEIIEIVAEKDNPVESRVFDPGIGPHNPIVYVWNHQGSRPI